MNTNTKTIDITPTWGEVGLMLYRIAEGGHTKSVRAARPEFARAFAMAEVFSALNSTLTEEQKALASKVLVEELAKQGF